MVKTVVEKQAVYQDVIISEECRCDRCGRHLWFHTKDGYEKPGLKRTKVNSLYFECSHERTWEEKAEEEEE